MNLKTTDFKRNLLGRTYPPPPPINALVTPRAACSAAGSRQAMLQIFTNCITSIIQSVTQAKLLQILMRVYESFCYTELWVGRKHRCEGDYTEQWLITDCQWWPVNAHQLSDNSSLIWPRYESQENSQANSLFPTFIDSLSLSLNFTVSCVTVDKYLKTNVLISQYVSMRHWPS